jgi:hypothetical protein
MPKTTSSMVSVAGAQRRAAWHVKRAAAKLTRVASRATHCITQAIADRVSAPRLRPTGRRQSSFPFVLPHPGMLPKFGIHHAALRHLQLSLLTSGESMAAFD